MPDKAAESLAGILYRRYCEGVGGKAFNGDPLPSWETFRADPEKQKQSDAWIATAEEAQKWQAFERQRENWQTGPIAKVLLDIRSLCTRPVTEGNLNALQEHMLHLGRLIENPQVEVSPQIFSLLEEGEIRIALAAFSQAVLGSYMRRLYQKPKTNIILPNGRR